MVAVKGTGDWGLGTRDWGQGEIFSRHILPGCNDKERLHYR